MINADAKKGTLCKQAQEVTFDSVDTDIIISSIDIAIYNKNINNITNNNISQINYDFVGLILTQDINISKGMYIVVSNIRYDIKYCFPYVRNRMQVLLKVVE